MLGKLTRWLRILGQDVKYTAKFVDSELLKIADNEKRVLLTRDFMLYKSSIANGLDAYYVEGTLLSDCLLELVTRYNLPLVLDINNIRCSLCNNKLKSVPKAEIKKNLKEKTLLYYNKFWKCPRCDQVYWFGSHWKQINKTLNQIHLKTTRYLKNKKGV